MFLCYGSRLANHLRAALDRTESKSMHLHGLMARLIREAELRRSAPSRRGARPLRHLLPGGRDRGPLETRSLRLRRRARPGRGARPPQADLCPVPRRPPRGEMASGTWRLFYDPNQDIFMGGITEGTRASRGRRRLLPTHQELPQHPRDRPRDLVPFGREARGDTRRRRPRSRRGVGRRHEGLQKCVGRFSGSGSTVASSPDRS